MLDRRVHGPEFRQILGVGTTWFRTMQERGVVPRGRCDPGGRRQWWTETEVRDTLERLKNPTQEPAAA